MEEAADALLCFIPPSAPRGKFSVVRRTPGEVEDDAAVPATRVKWKKQVASDERTENSTSFVPHRSVVYNSFRRDNERQREEKEE